MNYEVRRACRLAIAVAGGSLVSGAVLAQQPATATSGELEEVTVTGFRASLGASLDVKRKEAGSTDTIMAEDIADFPDLNLSESIQRLPGVSIARDAGEGRQISVRGLGPQFTRVRINGMEAMTTTGGTDAAGGTNRGRGFDFNIFASDLFNPITVRKTASADVEEGSLGATVDLQVARPFDYNGFTLVTSAQLGYNDLSESFDPRASLLVSNSFGDGRFGALLSVAYSQRELADEGSSTVRWQNGGRLPDRGPGTGYHPAQVNNAFRPRIPRYDIYAHEQDRLGVTGSLQFAPSDCHAVQPRCAVLDTSTAAAPRCSCESPNFSSAALNQVDVLEAEIDSPELRWSMAGSTTWTSAASSATTSCRPSSCRSRSTASHEFSETWSIARTGRLCELRVSTTRSRRHCCGTAPTSRTTSTTTATTRACR